VIDASSAKNVVPGDALEIIALKSRLVCPNAVTVRLTCCHDVERVVVVVFVWTSEPFWYSRKRSFNVVPAHAGSVRTQMLPVYVPFDVVVIQFGESFRVSSAVVDPTVSCAAKLPL